MYGMSQNPDTKDYIMVFSTDNYCEECDLVYTNINYKWCKSCQINNLKFTNWASGNENIDDFIQEMQLKIDNSYYIVFEWIPYNQFSNIKEIGKGGFATVYSAIWKDGPLKHNKDNEEYTRNLNFKVALKCLHNSQNITNEFLNEVCNLCNLNFNF